MTMTNEINLSALFDLSIDNDVAFDHIAPREIGAYVSTKISRVATVGTYVTKARADTANVRVTGSYVGDLVAETAVAGAYISR